MIERCATKSLICLRNCARDRAESYRMAHNGATHVAILALATKCAVIAYRSKQKGMQRVSFIDVPTVAAISNACAGCEARLLAWLVAAPTTAENSMRAFDCSFADRINNATLTECRYNISWSFASFSPRNFAWINLSISPSITA